jgi:hypothetical protein
MKTDDHIWNKVIEDIKKSENADYHRGKSWMYCYLFFRDYKKFRDGVALQEYAALHMGFFLASWGMLRGSSPLLQHDYKIYIPIVRILIKTKYDPLWNVSYPLSSKKTENVIKLLFSLKGDLEEKFKKEGCNFKTTPDLLITKIIMATMGCVPAYDRYFKNGLKKLGIKYYSNFSKKSFKNLLCACNNGVIQRMYEIHRRVMRTRFFYPPMKLLDLYCWFFGQ